MSTRTTTGGIAPRTSPQWGWVAASGVIGILIGVLALFFPGVTILSAASFGIGVIALFIALGFILHGGAAVGLAMSMRRSAP